ncbi:uncharacterized protein LOC108472191 [Gossypium arboreum]|uniref:uncharacterized protein LOC108472191 n=1 Tax=Gossypium arboreum TaxID=29729 RepID=UPI00081919E6|nr:uncharacterized protein LOC108472191 [Gossypium arboreum]
MSRLCNSLFIVLVSYEHLQVVFQLLQEKQFYAKLSKCEFWLPKVTFLGHVVFAEEIQVDPKNIEVIFNWKQAKNVLEIYSFLGLVGYHRKFVEGFSLITASLTKGLHKNALFVWTDEQQSSFKKLKIEYHSDKANVVADALSLRLILREAYSNPYAMHPGGNKMYRDFRELYWWSGLKREWLPLTPTKKDSVWVIVDRLTKSGHFIPVWIDYSLQKLAKLYISEIVRLHRTDSQSERVIQILEDMLRSCVIDFQGSWEDFLLLAEFDYNNSFQSSI